VSFEFVILSYVIYNFSTWFPLTTSCDFGISVFIVIPEMEDGIFGLELGGKLKLLASPHPGGFSGKISVRFASPIEYAFPCGSNLQKSPIPLLVRKNNQCDHI
jgi:hypothetical protein